MKTNTFFKFIVAILVAVIVMLIGTTIDIAEPKMILSHAIVALVSLVVGYILKQPKK